jgi:hypothetical protein
MDRVGIGTVKIIVGIDGLLDEDWQHLEKVDAVVKNDLGEKRIENVEIDKEKKQVSFIYKTEVESVHRVGLELFFDDGTSMTSYNSYTFVVQREW